MPEPPSQPDDLPEEEPLPAEEPPPEEEDLRTVQMSVPIPGEDAPIPAPAHPPRERRPSEDDLHTIKLDSPTSSSRPPASVAPPDEDSEEAATIPPSAGVQPSGSSAPSGSGQLSSGMFDAQSATIKTDVATPFGVDSATIKTDASGAPLPGEATVAPKGGAGVPPTDIGSRGSGSSSKGSLRSKRIKQSGALKEGEVYAGKYELLNEIARGGMGVVYRARQVDLNRMVALKVMLAGNYATEDDRRRFILEAEASARLKHPNIVPVYEIGEVEGNLYFTMDYIDGVPLSDRYGDLDRTQLLEVMIKVCAGVAYAHQRGIIHRDLKPQNVMMTKEDVPLIMDFGLAKQVEITDAEGNPDSRTREGQVMGTPHYMPPEQAEGLISEIDVRSDVWALGVMLYQMYVGELPFQGRGISELMLNIFDRDPTPPRQLDPTIDPDLEAIILKALEKPKDKRYDTAGTLQQDLERLQGGLPISARRATTFYRFQKWSKRNRTSLVVGVAFTLAVSILGGFGIYQYGATLREREVVEADRREQVIDEYLEAVAAVRGDQAGFASAVAVTSGTAAKLFGQRGGWEARVRQATTLTGESRQQAAQVATLAQKLDRFRGAGELEVPAGADSYEAIRTARDQALTLSEGRTALREQLAGLGERLSRLRSAHVSLQAAERARAALAASAQAAASELAAVRGSGEQVKSWDSLAGALKHFQSKGLRSKVEPGGLVEVTPSERSFGEAAREQRRCLFQILSVAEADSPEQEAAQLGLTSLQDSERVVAKARERQADERLAALAANDCRGLLSLLASSAAAGAKDEDRLRGARLAQAIAQRGLEAPLEEVRLAPLRDLYREASYRYAEVLLDLRAYPIYLAEVSQASAFRPADLKRLDARYSEMLNNRKSLGATLEKLFAKVAEQPIAILSSRLETLASIEDGVKGDNKLERRWGEVDVALRSARAERAIGKLTLASEEAERQSRLGTAADRTSRLEILVRLWGGVAALAKELEPLLPPGRSRSVRAAAGLAIGGLYLEQAVEMEGAKNIPLAEDYALKAKEAFEGLTGVGDQEDQVTELLASLAQESGAPKGMVSIPGLTKLRLGGGGGDRNEPRTVDIKAFYLGVNEVTNDEFHAFLLQTADGQNLSPRPTPEGWGPRSPRPGTGDLPVTGISFQEAQAYAEAYDYRLPTDAEWEYAARLQAKGGVQPFPADAYPWGNEWDADALGDRLLPPGSRPRDKNKRNVHDLAGNVSEWVVLKTADGEVAARGASYLYPFKRIARAGYRLRPDKGYRGPQLGFRVAKDGTGGTK
ncbi:MAG: protein kinase [Planctomycetes bacterium]|nr:protein kinase [Planctomycetota bacterium]